MSKNDDKVFPASEARDYTLNNPPEWEKEIILKVGRMIKSAVIEGRFHVTIFKSEETEKLFHDDFFLSYFRSLGYNILYDEKSWNSSWATMEIRWDIPAPMKPVVNNYNTSNSSNNTSSDNTGLIGGAVIGGAIDGVGGAVVGGIVGSLLFDD